MIGHVAQIKRVKEETETVISNLCCLNSDQVSHIY